MTPLNTIIEEKIKEFDDLYIHNNVWKSDDETLAYAPIEGMRQWIHDALTTAIQRAYEAGQSEERAKIRESFDKWNNSTEDIQDWADRVLTPDKTPEE